MKLLICSIGPGETSQAYAIAKYFHEKGHTVTLSLVKKINLDFLPHLPFHTTVTETPKDLTDYVQKNKPDAILFCNSKIFHRVESFLKHSPFPPTIPVFTLDSNWLFELNSIKYSFIPWADKYFINLPEKVFHYGLKERGGYFKIDKEYQKRIEVAGLVPSYKKISTALRQETRRELGISADEKLIFCYFSGFGSDSKEWVLANLIRAIKILNPKHSNKIKVLYIGALEKLESTAFPQWVIFPKRSIIDMEYFYRYLSSADLIFQHQGLGTLAQAISANIPVIANVSIQQFKEKAAIHPGEVTPFARLNLCKMLYKSTDTKNIAATVEKVLFNEEKRTQMILSQQKHFMQGEANILHTILNYVKKNK